MNIRALTICQPYAHLIVVTKEKRVENRDWKTNYRGTLLIHAGKSRAWLTGGGFDPPHMTFGAIIGTAQVTDCINYRTHVEGARLPERLRWMYHHDHTNGPFCLVLDDVKELIEPVPCKGAQGLWIPTDDILAKVYDNLPNPIPKASTP